MQKRFLIILSLFLFSSLGLAQSRFYKPTEKIVFSYEEFRTLNAEHQALWLKELRNFNRNVDLVIQGERLTAKKPRFWSFLELKGKSHPVGLCSAMRVFFQSSVQSAYAADQACSVRKQVKAGSQEICIFCPGDAVSGVNVCASSFSEAPNISKNLLAEFKKSDYRGPQLDLSQEKLTALVETTIDEGSAPFTAPIVRREVVVKKIVTPASSYPVVVELSPDANVELESKKISKAEPITIIEKRDKDAYIVHRAGNDKRTPDFKLKELGDTGSFRGNENLDVEEVVNTDRLACIYGGFAVQTKGACHPISEKEMFDQEGKKVFYSCKNPPSNSSHPVIVGADDANSIVMCNPIVFGTLEGKPLCIPRSKNATEECAKKSSGADQALAFAKSNPQEYRSLVRRVSSLCQQDEDVLRTHFKKRGKSTSQINNAIKDLSMTCVHLRGRMAELIESNRKTAPSAGVR